MKTEDIQIRTIRITDTFRYGGVIFVGLKDLRRYADEANRRGFGLPPYVVRKDQRYPCFDSSDFGTEDRYYQAYFLTRNKKIAEAIYEEAHGGRYDSAGMRIEDQYPVMEPLRNMHHIQAYQLPYIYYHGEGDTMDVVEDRNASWKVEILAYPWKRERYDEKMQPCLYGPPPGEDLWYKRRFDDEFEDELDDVDDSDLIDLIDRMIK